MSDLNIKTWVRTDNLYGKPLSIDELDYCNGIYLAHAEEHPNGSKPFQTIMIADENLQNWQHRVTSPERTHSLKNVRITGHKDKFVCAATSIKEGIENLEVMTSSNGFDWLDVYTSNGTYNKASIVKSMAGGIVIACHGKLVYSSDLTEWKESEFNGIYKDYDCIDLTYFDSTFFVLLKNDDKFAIGYTKDLQDYIYYDLEWGKSHPTSLESSGTQMVITCSDQLAERVSFYYTKDGKKNEWSRYEIKTPYRTISNSLSELFSSAFYNNQWVFVGRVREYNNSRSMLFSYKPILLRIEGELTSKSVLIEDNIDSTDLTYVQAINDKLICYGKSHPNGDNCLFVLE